MHERTTPILLHGISKEKTEIRTEENKERERREEKGRQRKKRRHIRITQPKQRKSKHRK